MLTIVVMPRKNTTLKGTPGYVDPSSIQLPPNEDLPPAEVDQDLEEVAYVDRTKNDDDDDDGDNDHDKSDDYSYDDIDDGDNSADDDDWHDLTNDATLKDLKALDIKLNFW